MLTPDFVRFIPPAQSDEAALALSQLLRQLSQRFDECFREQIRRAHVHGLIGVRRYADVPADGIHFLVAAFWCSAARHARIRWAVTAREGSAMSAS